MQLEGAWDEALAEAERARGRAGMSGSGVALAHYRRGDLLRLRGEFAAAEEAYREASRCGREPQPGLALLRLAQRNAKAAAATIRRAVAEGTEPSKRVALLPAHVEIMLAVDAIEDARRGCSELEEVAGGYEGGMVGALAAHARGSFELANGDPQAALGPLRGAVRPGRSSELPTRPRARACWSRSHARRSVTAMPPTWSWMRRGPYSRSWGGAGSRTGEQARRRRQGRSDRPRARGPAARRRRQHQQGDRRRAGPERATVDRHVSNIYAKLDVPSRAAATAYAYEHGLI